MAYIGRNLEQFSNVEKLDNITFTNSAGPYNLLKGAVAFTPVNAQSLLIEVDGIIQASDSYTVSGSTITFGVSMASTSTMNSIVQLGVGLISTPADSTVSTAKLEDGAVTGAKVNSTFDVSAKTVTLPASVSGLGTGITNAQLAGSIDVTSKITGVVPTANLGSGSASASTYLAGDQSYKTITEFNDNKIVNDISTLALHQATNNNSSKYNLTNSNVDVYQDSTAIANLTNVSRDTTGEYIFTGTDSTGSQALIDRTAGTAISGIAGAGEYTANGGVAAAFDGTISKANSACAKQAGGYTNYSWLGKDWGVGVTRTINGFKYQSSTDDGINAVSSNTSGGKLELFGSATNDTTVATNLGGLSSLNMKLMDNDYSILTGLTTSTAYRYHWVRQYVVNAGHGICGQLRFYENPVITTINATGSYESTAQTANASVSTISGVVTYTNADGTATLNTDIVLEVSADNGSTWQSAALTAAGTFSTGVLQAVTNDISVTAGTQLKYKISFANQSDGVKVTRINGVSLSY